MQHAARLVLCACAMLLALAARATPWPAPPLPQDAQVEVVAQDMVLNGQPSRVLRFKASASQGELLDFYRQKFGAQRVEHRARDTRVIAARQGDHFITVQLRPLAGGQVQATVMTTLLRPASKSATAAATEKWLPPDTALLSTLQSNDGGKHSVMVVGANRSSLQANRDHVVAALQDRGFRVVKEAGAATQPRAALSLQLSSASEAVELTISDAGAYRALVINRTKEAP